MLLSGGLAKTTSKMAPSNSVPEIIKKTLSSQKINAKNKFFLIVYLSACTFFKKKATENANK